MAQSNGSGRKRLFKLHLTRDGFVRTLKTAYVYPENAVRAAAERLARGGHHSEVLDAETGRVLATGTREGLTMSLTVSAKLDRGIHSHAPLPWKSKRN